MADQLPEDPHKWPDDPFRLLGVDQPTTEQDLKRAYTRLIRRFKPEHFPEQFRRIREAYESALQQIKWFQFFPPAALTPSDPPVVETTSSNTPAPIVEKTEEPSPRPLPLDPVEEAWAFAVSGERAGAYSRLVELASAQPAEINVSLRLYWLLALDPKLDPDRTRHDWLAAALTRSHLGGSPAELYRRELAINPETALFGPYAHLLEARDAMPGTVLWLARERLTAAGTGRWWARLDSDFSALVDRQAQFDETAWLSYLVAVMGFVSLEDLTPTIERCSNQIRLLRHLELAHSWAFDQLDEIKSRAAIWQRATVVPNMIREVVRSVWSGPYGAWRKPLQAAAAWVAENPVQALFALDRAAQNADAHPFLVSYNQLLASTIHQEATEYPAGLIRGLVTAFLANETRKEYLFMRPALARLMIDEAIDPGELVSACAVDRRYMTRSLVDHIRGDVILHLVCRTVSSAARG